MTTRGGRIPGSRNKRTEALLALAEDGETPCAFALRIMREDGVDPLLKLQAAKLAAPYIHPKPQPEPRLISISLPEEIKTAEDLMAAHAEILKAAANGTLALEDARDLSAILETQRKLVEAIDHEARLIRLESERKQ